MSTAKITISTTEKYIITNHGNLFNSELNTTLLNSDQSVYEVIRVIDGIALFLEDHYTRLVSSVQMSGFNFEMDLPEFRHNILELVRLNHIKNGNVKFVLAEFKKVNHWSFSFIPHSYPDTNDYEQGVKAELLFAERENPNAKIIQNVIRERANKMIADQELYEVLLVDRDGLITEGSRSNVFFVKGNRFYTAPAYQVLVGVTRQKVLECLTELGFTIVEEAVLASEINTYDAAFLTGTSPKVLPVRSIGKQVFNTQLLVVNELMNQYNSMIDNYITAH
ncbi:MAG: aminotransferase class IV [Bacteroidota bacterium]|nr:aminotransferase class IV [Bacteroidota bacterium]